MPVWPARWVRREKGGEESREGRKRVVEEAFGGKLKAGAKNVFPPASREPPPPPLTGGSRVVGDARRQPADSAPARKSAACCLFGARLRHLGPLVMNTQPAEKRPCPLQRVDFFKHALYGPHDYWRTTLPVSWDGWKQEEKVSAAHPLACARAGPPAQPPSRPGPSLAGTSHLFSFVLGLAKAKRQIFVLDHVLPCRVSSVEWDVATGNRWSGVRGVRPALLCRKSTSYSRLCRSGVCAPRTPLLPGSLTAICFFMDTEKRMMKYNTRIGQKTGTSKTRNMVAAMATSTAFCDASLKGEGGFRAKREKERGKALGLDGDEKQKGATGSQLPGHTPQGTARGSDAPAAPPLAADLAPRVPELKLGQPTDKRAELLVLGRQFANVLVLLCARARVCQEHERQGPLQDVRLRMAARDARGGSRHSTQSPWLTWPFLPLPPHSARAISSLAPSSAASAGSSLGVRNASSRFRR